MLTLTCRWCEQEWQTVAKRGNRPAWCPPCRPIALRERQRIQSAKYRNANPEYMSEWRKQNYPTQKRAIRSSRLRSKFNITIEMFEEMLAAQGGNCAICGTAEPGGKGAFHVDHDHACCSSNTKTCGECIRGLLCHSCNSSLLPGYERLPRAMQDSPHLNAYLSIVIENDPLLVSTGAE